MIDESYFDNFPQLESERLIFRQFKMSDALDIQFIRSNDEVMTYMDSKRHTSLQDSEKFVSTNIETYKKGEGIFWAIIEKSTNEFVGDFAYWKLDKTNCRGEIGYTLKPQFWGRGYMNETMLTLIDFGFRQFKLHSIEANINPNNSSSRKVLTKIGFKKEAYFRENYFFEGKFLDSEIYSLLESDFIA